MAYRIAVASTDGTEKALANMVFEKAVEYHKSPTEFITA